MIAEVIHGDLRLVLPTLPERSFDAVVTDPPYGLGKPPDTVEVLRHWLEGDDYEAGGRGFMGQAWDSFVPGPAWWREVFRVMKPGAYGVAFFAPRTYDLGVMAMRLAGFEIRDALLWLNGQGFPKSQWISDLLDKAKPRDPRVYTVTKWIAQARDASGKTNAEVDAHFGTRGMSAHWTSQGTQPTVPEVDTFAKLQAFFGVEAPAEVSELVAVLNDAKGEPGEAWQGRPVVGKHRKRAPVATWREEYADSVALEAGDVTALATEEARKWAGWGTGLAPRYEPIVLVQRPREGTYAANVRAYGVGGLNLDACRHAGDRWPPNVAIDETVANALGSRARFFYCPKTPTKEREAGLEGFTAASAGELTGGRKAGSAGLNNPRSGAGRTSSGRANKHPTVKPLALMRWLCRLVTPPGGTILDPFCGSGSTGCAAVSQGFKFIGVEKDADDKGYVEIARARIRHWAEHKETGSCSSIHHSESSAPTPNDLAGTGT